MLLQSTYALIDLYWIRGLGTASIAALSISLQAFFIILALAQVVAVTALAQISQTYGSGEIQKAHRLFSSFLSVATVLGIAAAVSAYFFAEPYVQFFAPRPQDFVEGSTAYTDATEVIRQGLIYFEINAITFCTQLMLIVLGMGFRGSGDFITPVKLMVSAVLINLVLDPLLIFGWYGFPELGIAGAAWATVIAQAIVLVGYVLVLIRRPKTSRSLRMGTPILNFRFFYILVTKGAPVGIQFMLLPIFLGIVLYAMKPFGAEWTATAGAGFRVLQQTLLPMVALGQSAAALAGQNFGANQLNRIEQTGQVSTRWMLLYGLMCTLCLFFAGRYVGHVFADSEAGLDLAQIYYWWSAPTVLAFALCFVPSSVLQALGKPELPLIAALARILMLALLVLWVIPLLGLGPQWVFGSASFTTFIEGGIGTWLMWRHLRHLQQTRPTPAPEPTNSEDRHPISPSDNQIETAPPNP